MAACCNRGAYDPNAAAMNDRINKDLRTAKREADNEVKLLLLGAGESGKSTIAKQIKILHLNGFGEDERATFKPVIYNNIIQCMKTVLAYAKAMEIKIKAKDSLKHFLKDDEEFYSKKSLDKDIADDIKILWKDKGVKQAYDSRSEYQLPDCAAYFFEHVDRISLPDYIPTDADILMGRSKTTGIIETDWEWAGSKFRMADVGGQRSERRKWMHCFQDVTAVLFVVAMSEYNQTLYEDEKTNRMKESLDLFGDICNSKWFTESGMILFLNKKDLFEAKIKLYPLTVAFPEYNGKQTYEECALYIQERFVDKNKDKKKTVYVHETCATDTSSIKVVFEAVKDVVLRTALGHAGVL